MPGPHASALIIVTAFVFYLYTRPWVRMEYVSLALMATLVILFYVFPYDVQGSRLSDVEIFGAFGHPALIAICSLMVMGRGLTMTGALEPAVRLLGKCWKFNATLGLLVTLLVAGAASAFLNDTPVLVLMLPMLLGLAERAGVSVSKTLMPANFAILAGGMLTSIGTSTNLLVLSIAVDLGMKPLGLFAFTATAATGFAVALPYLWLVAPRLLPDTQQVNPRSMREYEARIMVGAEADAESSRTDRDRIEGRTLAELERKLGRRLPIVGIARGDTALESRVGLTLEPGDSIVLRDTPTGLRDVASTLGVDLFDRSGPGRFIENDVSRVDMHFAEAVIGANSGLIGETLRRTRFAERHQVVVIGLNRVADGLLRRVVDIADQPMAVGDILLIQGSADRIQQLGRLPGLLILDTALVLPRSPLAPMALAIMGVVIVVAATKLLSIHVAAFLGALAMLLAGCVRLEGIGRALSLEVVLLVASSVALGHAFVVTDAADWLAGGIAVLIDTLRPAAQLAVFMSLAALLTNFVSNAAAAAVGTPIAVATAQTLGVPLEPFVLAILFGANLSFATPMAYQTNLLVMNAAGYRFADFVRVGVPLVVLMLVTLSLLLARRYGL
jgi:di/tricarboxylate transporter